jgi:hypothetical protein
LPLVSKATSAIEHPSPGTFVLAVGLTLLSDGIRTQF